MTFTACGAFVRHTQEDEFGHDPAFWVLLKRRQTPIHASHWLLKWAYW